MKIDILHVRDPDSACDVRVWLDGVELDYSSFSVEDIDPGRGWEWADWKDRLRWAAVELPKGSYRDAVLAALGDPPAQKHIAGWREPAAAFTPTIEPEFLLTWESQVLQYPLAGPPGIGYFAGELEDEAKRVVDCLLYRNGEGEVVGILNHYPAAFDWSPHEKPGAVNVWVHPAYQRLGIGQALWEEAVRRWSVTLEGQRFTPAGAALAAAVAQ